MKGMGKDKGMGLLIGIGKPPKDDAEGYGSDGDEMMEDEGETRELKVTAARAFLSAVKGNDPEAMVDALDAYMEC